MTIKKVFDQKLGYNLPVFFFQLITIGFFSGSPTVNSVQKVKLSCDRGVIRWIQPSGAAQISIAPRNGKPITICFKVNHLVEETVSIRLISRFFFD